MNDEDLIRLQHMLDYAREARVFATGHKQTDLHHDRALMHILIRLVEVIGEAASKVSRETRDQLPQFEWQDIIGMRNKLIHVYHNINLYVLWDTVDKDLPELIEKLEKVSGLR